MSRVEELTLAMADGVLGDEEERELALLMARDAQARKIHVDVLAIEDVLLGDRSIDVIPRVMQEIRSRRIVQRVMSTVRERALPPAPRRARIRTRMVWPAAAACLLVGGAAAGWKIWRGKPVGTLAPDVVAVALVREATAPSYAQLGSKKRELRAGLALVPGETVETGPGASATLTYESSATLALGEQSRVALPAVEPAHGTPGGRAAVTLTAGELRVAARPRPVGRPLVVATPHALATVLGTRFSLLVSTESTQMEVQEGQVLFEDLSSESVVTVVAGQKRVARARPSQASVPAPGPRAAGSTGAAIKHDFEDGDLPAGFAAGRIVSGPERSGSRSCLAATLIGVGATGYGIRRGFDPLLPYSDALVIKFDYWGDWDDGAPLTIGLRSFRSPEVFTLRLPSAARRSWAHVAVKAADFRGRRDSSLALTPGDLIGGITIRGGVPGSEALFVDDLEIVDPLETERSK